MHPHSHSALIVISMRLLFDFETFVFSMEKFEDSAQNGN